MGVGVFDVKPGKALSVNREAKRIVGGLLSPSQRVEELLEIVALRRPDGWEISTGRVRRGQSP